MEANDLTCSAASSLWGTAIAVRRHGIDSELTDVADSPAGAFEEPQSKASSYVIANGCVAHAREVLIALLAIARVVEGAVLRPLVEVPMLMTGAGVGEDEYVRRLLALADVALPATAVAIVKLLTQYGVARLQVPLRLAISRGSPEGVTEGLPLCVVEAMGITREERT